MRGVTLEVLALCCWTCAPLEEASSLSVDVRADATVVQLGYERGCPTVSGDAVATLNGVSLPMTWAGGIHTSRTRDGESITSCVAPTWSVGNGSAPPARETVEVSAGKSSVRAAFDTPLAEVDLLEPANGRFPALTPGPDGGTYSSVTIVVRANLPSAAVREAFFMVDCEGLRRDAEGATWLEGGRLRLRLSPDRVPTMSTTQLPVVSSGTHRCEVSFNYRLAATDCSLARCELRRDGVRLFSSARPDQLAGFTLEVP